MNKFNNVRRIQKLGAFALCTATMLVTENPAAQMLEEIIVTAQKREQSLSDVNISLTAFGGESLRNMRTESLTDLSELVSGMDISESIAGTNPRIVIRGVGLNDFSSNASSSVGVYVDDVYQVSLASLDFTMFDLERVEVLRGPQGTLYGRNSNGGAINVISTRPSEEAEGFLKAGYGAYETTELQGAIGGPLSEHVRGRLSLFYKDQGETYYETETNGKDFGNTTDYGLRAQVAADFSDSLTGSLKLEYAKSEYPFLPGKASPILNQSGIGRCGPALRGDTSRMLCDDASAVFAPGSPSNLFYSDQTEDPWKRRDPVGTDVSLDGDSETSSGTMRLEWDLGDLAFTSLTSYQTIDRVVPNGEVNELEIAVIIPEEEIDSFSQEFRLNGSNDLVNWVVGVFYSDDTIKSEANIYARDFLATNLLTVLDQDTETAAGYGNIEWSLTDQLRLTTGLRYTWEDRSYVGGTTDVNPYDSSCLIDPFCAPTGIGAVPLSFMDDELSETDLSYRIGLDYQPNEDWLFYGNVSTGFKSGGWFGDFTFDSSELEPFDPEEIIAYELGFKATLADGALRWNSAFFYYDYNDLQTLVPSTLSLKFDNVEEADIQGVETELLWAPLEGLNLQFNATYLDTELGEFGLIPKGNNLPNAPELSYAGQARYHFAINDSYTLEIAADCKYTDEMYRDATNEVLAAVDDSLLFNASVTLLQNSADWKLSLWGKNLTDERYEENVFISDFAGLKLDYYNAPRTYGISFEKTL